MRFFIIYFFSTAIILASNSDYLEKFQQKQLHTPICNIVINEKELNVENGLLGFLNLKNKIKNIEDFENLYKRSDLKRNQPILYSQNGFIKQINYITGEAIARDGQKAKFDLDKCFKKEELPIDPLLLDYKNFIESKYSIDLWNYYVIAHDFIETVNKHNSFYIKVEKLTPYDLVEMHPYKTRNLTIAQKEEIKVKLKEFENQLPKIYYSYSDDDIEKRIIFNEVVKKYNDNYIKLK